MPNSLQNTINHYQNLYRQWHSLQANNNALLTHLSHQNAIADELAAFYHGDTSSDWLAVYEAVEQGATVPCTQGEHSIISQDTLWDMLCDERAFYEQLQQFATQRLQQLNQNNN